MRFEQSPVHIDAGDALAVTVRLGPTVMVTLAEAVQPPEFPVTVYVVVVVGETVMLAPVIPPGCQLYEVAPVAVSVEDCPEQIEAGDAVTFTGQLLQNGKPEILLITVIFPLASTTRMGQVPGGAALVPVAKLVQVVMVTAQPGGMMHPTRHALQSWVVV